VLAVDAWANGDYTAGHVRVYDLRGELGWVQ
jgi:hypothetical protein